MDGTHDVPCAGPPAAPPLPPAAAVPPPLAAGAGAGFFQRLPKEVLNQILDAVCQHDVSLLRLCDRATRDAVDGLGWQRLTVRRPRPFYLSSARARSF